MPTQVNSSTRAGREIGYAQITSNATLSTSEGDVAGLTITVTCDGSPIEVEFFGLTQKQTNAGALLVYLYEGASKLATGGGTLAVNDFANAVAKARLTPSAGTHTYKVRAALSSAGGIISTAVDSPAFITATAR